MLKIVGKPTRKVCEELVDEKKEVSGTLRYLGAADEGVTLVPAETATEGCVVNYITLGVLAATLLARVTTLLLYTSFARSTLLTHDTLRPTERRTADVVRAAGAHRAPLLHLTEGVAATR